MEGYYKIVELDEYGGRLKIKERSFRNLEPNEVLIRVVCTTVHPADLMFIKGNYGDTQQLLFPIIPGFEASGEIIKVGDSMDRKYVGSKVGIFANFSNSKNFEGLWTEYHYTTLSNLIFFDKDIQFERICFLINPLTAVGIIDSIRKQKAENILLTAATSNVGKMIIKLCQRENINVISLVRDHSKFNELKQFSANNVIVQSDPEWLRELEKLCFQFKTPIAFDCIGGDFIGKILTVLPKGATLYSFGNLSERDLGGIETADLIYYDKTVAGWWLSTWINSIKPDELEYWKNLVQFEIKSYSTTFETTISKEFKLVDINKAIDYYKSHMHEGKVILKSNIETH